MPILQVSIAGAAPAGVAQRIADAAAAVLGAGPRSTWVELASVDYAENGGVEEGVAPVLVRVIQKASPDTAQARALTDAIARACGRPPENVHLIFEPPAGGRVAFGGEIVD